MASLAIEMMERCFEKGCGRQNVCAFAVPKTVRNLSATGVHDGRMSQIAVGGGGTLARPEVEITVVQSGGVAEPLVFLGISRAKGPRLLVFRAGRADKMVTITRAGLLLRDPAGRGSVVFEPGVGSRFDGLSGNPRRI